MHPQADAIFERELGDAARAEVERLKAENALLTIRIAKLRTKLDAAKSVAREWAATEVVRMLQLAVASDRQLTESELNHVWLLRYGFDLEPRV